MVELTKYDAAEFLDSEEAIQAYLEAALEDDDPKYFLKALNNVARARGMMEVAKQVGMPRESLYRALSDNGNPNYSTFMKILAGLGISLSIKQVCAR